MTSLRVIAGASALFLAVQQEPGAAAALLSLAVITDVVDGWLARKLRVTGDFGRLFDCYADYLYYVVAPTVLLLACIRPVAAHGSYFVLSLAPLAGAIRYAWMAPAAIRESFNRLGVLGLPTTVFAFYSTALVLLNRNGNLAAGRLNQVVLLTFPILCLLMVAPVRYPRLIKYPAVAIPVLTGLNVMPFAYTRVLGTLTVAVCATYTVLSPLWLYLPLRHHGPPRAVAAR